MRTLLPLLLVSCIDLDRGPEWDTYGWRDTGADDWVDSGRQDDTDEWTVVDTEGPGDARCSVIDSDLLPVEDGDSLVVYWGPQGLWHVFAGVVCESSEFEPGGDIFDFANADNPTVTMELIDDERGRIGGYVDLRRGMDWSGVPALVDEQLVIRTTTCEENLGREVTLRVEVEDVNGLRSEQAVRVLLVADPDHVFPDPVDTDDSPVDTDADDTDTEPVDTDDTDVIPDPGETGGADTGLLDTGDTDPA